MALGGHLKMNKIINTIKPVYNEHPRDHKMWPLSTGGRCSEATSCYTDRNWDPKTVVVVGKWSLFGGGR